MSSVLQNEKSRIDQGKFVNEAANRGLVAFSADMMMSHLVKGYQLAEQIYGETILRLISGYDPSYLERNIKIPEFQREMVKILKGNIAALKEQGVLNKEGEVTEEGYDRAAFALYVQELERLIPSGMVGQRVHKHRSFHGDWDAVRPFKRGDRYRDFAVKQSIKMALRRGHKELMTEDLRTFERNERGEVHIIYGLDASGSMKGKKLEAAKKAGVALAYQAIAKQDYAGLIVFGSGVTDSIGPTRDMKRVVKAIAKVRASKETEFGPLMECARTLFRATKGTKHLVILTDAVPTVGKNPGVEALKAVAQAKDEGITVSIVGIGLDTKASTLAREMVELGEGRFYTVRNLDVLDTVILEDYYSVR